jgi:tRNA U34 5-methylaminomethyl-2-thiouridine-forming methyltransferase MnmC
MDRTIILTKDGSHSIAIPSMDVTYHSVHGAIQESQHVFIKAGLLPLFQSGNQQPVHILEMGFGTGLNALLTLMEAEKNNRLIHFTTLELFPLVQEQVAVLNYCSQLHREDLQPTFEQLHTCSWEEQVDIHHYFTLHKKQQSLLDITVADQFHLIYFDAFAPAAQPELWTIAAFEKLYHSLLPGGVLVTYCSKGDVRRAMQSAGFIVEKIPGPPGKREMVRAVKV